ncbi:hydroxymethylglutaryl-CoA lyase [bacterium endosymbiont of Mortierella elongata FMR23-6]|nr:hydroxymethylglutaryl-CoA lyase [bacterium endosymbiont of Mortierella elongata FMR23-6]
MIDLEDPVAPNLKHEAREKLAQCLATPHSERVKFAVRVNSLRTQDGLKDLLEIFRQTKSPDYIILSKVENPQEIIITEEILGQKENDIQFLAAVETPEGVANAKEIARASLRLKGLIFGAADYASSIGSAITWDSLYFARAQVLNAAKITELEIIDTPYFDARDFDGLIADSLRVRELGYTGKAAIHPLQIQHINEIFQPDEAELYRARRIVATAQENEGNAYLLDGTLIGTPLIKAAQRLLDKYDQINR